MSTNTGNTVQIQAYADFSSRVLGNLWPALKGKLVADQMAGMKDDDIIKALQKGFLCPTELVPLSKMDGVWMFKDAKELFDGNIGSVCKTESDVLTQPLNDHEIIEKYGGDVVFNSVDNLEATIADLISKQPEGKSGKLLNHSCANIFYVSKNTEIQYVFVDWHSAIRRWGVSSNRIDDTTRPTSSHVFRLSDT